MNKLKSVIGVFATIVLLAAGIVVGAAPVGAVTCGAMFPVNSQTYFDSTYDNWAQRNTTVVFYLIEYSDYANPDDYGACDQFFVKLNVTDGNTAAGLALKMTVTPPGSTYVYAVTCPPDNAGNGQCSMASAVFISGGPAAHISATNAGASTSNWCGVGTGSTTHSYFYYGGFSALCNHHFLSL